MDSLKGRCISCGFLSKRATKASGDGIRRRVQGFFEVLPEERATPTIAITFIPDTFTGPIESEMACYRHRPYFPLDRLTNAKLRESVQEPLNALSEDRNCEAWCGYEPGLSPQEHLMELRQQQLEQDRRDFQLQIANLEQRWRADSDRVITRLTRFGIKVAVVLGLVQLLVGLMAGVAQLTPDSVGYRLWFGPRVAPPPISD